MEARPSWDPWLQTLLGWSCPESSQPASQHGSFFMPSTWTRQTGGEAAHGTPGRAEARTPLGDLCGVKLSSDGICSCSTIPAATAALMLLLDLSLGSLFYCKRLFTVFPWLLNMVADFWPLWLPHFGQVPSQMVSGASLINTGMHRFQFDLMLLCSLVCHRRAWEAPSQQPVLSKAS